MQEEWHAKGQGKNRLPSVQVDGKTLRSFKSTKTRLAERKAAMEPKPTDLEDPGNVTQTET